MMNKFAELARRLNKAGADMEKGLETDVPVGTRVGCWLMSGQVTASTGEVIGHPGGPFAYLRIRLDSRTQQVRDVSVDDVRKIK